MNDEIATLKKQLEEEKSKNSIMEKSYHRLHRQFLGLQRNVDRMIKSAEDAEVQLWENEVKQWKDHNDLLRSRLRQARKRINELELRFENA